MFVKKPFIEICEAEYCYPTAYHVATISIGRLMFDNFKFAEGYFHKKSRGCAMDLCSTKSDVILKLKTADFCEDCMKLIKAKDISAIFFKQISDIVEDIRLDMLSKRAFIEKREPSPIRITNGRIPSVIFTDFNIEIPFSPLEKTVFLTFLKYPEGLTVHEFCGLKTELGSLYRKLSRSDDNSAIVKRINNLTNPLSNSLSEKISKIKSKLIAELGEEIAESYFIDGPNAEKKRIKIDRSLIHWEITN